MRLPFYTPAETYGVSEIARLKGLAPSAVSPSQLSEIVRLRMGAGKDESEARKSVQRLKGLADETAATAQETFSYKVPERKKPTKGQQAFGLGLGVLGALLRDPNAPQYTANVFQGVNAMNEQEYADQMEAVNRKMAQYEQAMRGKLAALSARMDAERTGLDFLTGRADKQLGLATGMEEGLRNQGNLDRQFAESVRQFGLSHALSKDAGRRADAELRLRQNPYGYISEQAKTLAPFFGGDEKKAAEGIIGDLIVNQAQAEWLPKTLEQTYNMNADQAARASEELKQLKVKGQFLPKQLQADLAGQYLSNANIRQTMDARKLEIDKAKKERDFPSLNELQTKQLNDAEAQVGRWRKIYDDLLAKKASAPKEEQAEYDPFIDGALKQLQDWKDKANTVMPGLYPSSKK